MQVATFARICLHPFCPVRVGLFKRKLKLCRTSAYTRKPRDRKWQKLFEHTISILLLLSVLTVGHKAGYIYNSCICFVRIFISEISTLKLHFMILLHDVTRYVIVVKVNKSYSCPCDRTYYVCIERKHHFHMMDVVKAMFAVNVITVVSSLPHTGELDYVSAHRNELGIFQLYTN